MLECAGGIHATYTTIHCGTSYPFPNLPKALCSSSITNDTSRLSDSVVLAASQSARSTNGTPFATSTGDAERGLFASKLSGTAMATPAEDQASLREGVDVRVFVAVVMLLLEPLRENPVLAALLLVVAPKSRCTRDTAVAKSCTRA